jgi:mRNA interferase MazF
VSEPYVPDAGDLVWLDFDPRVGHEQSGRRPAVVLTPRAYNQAANLAVVCPITQHAKGYPFEVLLPKGSPVEGSILADHVKSIDWQRRRAEYQGKAPAPVLNEVRERLGDLLRL